MQLSTSPNYIWRVSTLNTDSHTTVTHFTSRREARACAEANRALGAIARIAKSKPISFP